MDLLQHFLTSDQQPHSRCSVQFSRGLSAGYILKAWQIGRFKSLRNTGLDAQIHYIALSTYSKQLECARVIFSQVVKSDFEQTFSCDQQQ